MDPEQMHLLRTSYAVIEQRPMVAALIFFQRLFELEPRLQPLFRSSIEEQACRFLEQMASAFQLLDQPAELAVKIEELGARHVGYGARPEHYSLVRRALLDMLPAVLGAEFNAEVRLAWNQFYDVLQSSMLRGAATVEYSKSGAEPRPMPDAPGLPSPES
jgi:hemoglobin-like flavoprotein